MKNLFLLLGMMGSQFLYSQVNNTNILKDSAEFKVLNGENYLLEFNSSGNPLNKSYNSYFKSEVEASFPDGNLAWEKFSTRNLNKQVHLIGLSRRENKKMLEENKRFIAYISFIVMHDGTICNKKVFQPEKNQAIINETLRFINLNPKWKPAVRNGINVISTKSLQLTFETNQN